jgi:cysteine rich repeat protein
MIARSCRDNFRAYCADVDLGGGRAITCLNENAAKLTPDCRDALAKLAR